MGEVSWIKLKVGMFDDSKIKYIEALPERDTIITIWVKLLTYQKVQRTRLHYVI